MRFSHLQLWLLPSVLSVTVGFGAAAAILPAFGLDPLARDHMASLSAFAALAAIPGIGRSAALSLSSGLLATLVSTAIVFTFLAVAGRGRRRAARSIGPLLAIPHVAAAIGLAFLVAPSGWIMRLLSPWATGLEQPPDYLFPNDPLGLALTLGLIVKEVPFLLLLALAVLAAAQERRRLMLARSLGYDRPTAWLICVAPDIYRQIRLPVLAVLVYASSNIEMALVLGPTNPPVLAVVALRLLNDPDLAMRALASATICLQIAVSAFAIALWLAGERLVANMHHLATQSGRRSHFRYLPALIGEAGLTLVLLLTALLAAGLLLLSFTWTWRFFESVPSSLTLIHWMRASNGLAESVLASSFLAVAAGAIGLAMVIQYLDAQERLTPRGGMLRPINGIVFLPLLIPQIGFLPGLVTLSEYIGLRPGFAVVLAGHLLFAIPYLYLVLAAPYRRFDDRYMKIAKSMGSSHVGAVFAVKLAMLTNVLLATFAIGFAVSIGQFLPTLLLGAGRVTTMTTEAMALVAGGDRRVLGVWAVVLAALPTLVFAAALSLPGLIWRHRWSMRAAG